MSTSTPSSTSAPSSPYSSPSSIPSSSPSLPSSPEVPSSTPSLSPEIPTVEPVQPSTPQPTQPTNESVNPYNTILQQNEETPQQQQTPTKDQPQNELFVYQKLMNIYKNALLDDPQLTLNLFGQSGKIILRSSDLIDIIAHCCGVDKTCVRIAYFDDEDVNSCSMVSKISPFKEIQRILQKD